MSGCAVNTSLDVALGAVTVNSGAAKTMLGMPADVRFRGVDVFFQWLIFDPGLGKIPFHLSPGCGVALK